MARTSLPGGLTSIHDKNVTGHVVRCAGGEEDGRAFQVVFVAESTHGNVREEEIFVKFDRAARHMRRKPARSDRVHLNVVHCPFTSQIPCEADYTAFAGVISDRGKFRRSSTQSGYGGNIDDLAAPLLDHDLADCLGTKKGSSQVRLDDFVPILQPHVLDSSAPGDSGIVDEDIDFSELCERRIQDFFNARLAFDITG